jgi:hypothetical protein
MSVQTLGPRKIWMWRISTSGLCARLAKADSALPGNTGELSGFISGVQKRAMQVGRGVGVLLLIVKTG